MKLKELKNVIFTDLTIIDSNTNQYYNNVIVFDDTSIFNQLSNKEVIGIRTRIREIGSCAYSYLEIIIK